MDKQELELLIETPVWELYQKCQRFMELRGIYQDTDVNNSGGTSTTNGSANSTDNNITNEKITRTPADKISIYKDFIESKNNIYTMIFKDLDCLFYQLV